ncbi:DUF882 domain-containing protein [Hansschlegelia sp. KR7-227]|uniref:DUF882 domain-containing protein n=1 Tax=Hansschlegelia sp. KR7-227 TaxID=3400914 RepID=UPI003BFCB6F3
MLDSRSSRRFAAPQFKRSVSAVLLGALALIAGSEATQNAQANGDTRSLTLYHTHRGDQITVTFKRNGRYDSDGLRQLSYFLRDWRNNKQTRMEPRLFDIVWEAHRAVGRGQMINIVSAYRSPETNAMLRARSHGVAKFSQHMLGRAMDFYITGVPVSAVREAGMRLQRGGVGFYPTSGRPFVHLDAGSIRAWPRMSRSQLARLFPDGKTVHQPAEGGQMPGYQLAMAELKSRGEVSIDSAYSSAGGSSSGKGFFARLFGGGDEGEDNASEATAVASAAPARGAASSSSGDGEGASPAAPTRVATLRVPVPAPRPADMVRQAPVETVVASAAVPMPPIAPAMAQAKTSAEAEIRTASIPLPPVAPAVVAAKPVPLPPAAPIQLASAETDVAVAETKAGPDLVWRAGAQPHRQGETVGSAEPALALASSIPTPRPRPTSESAVAVLAALPTPGPAASAKPREIDPQVASAYQAEAATFPRLPDAFLQKRGAAAESAEMALAYAPEAVDLPRGSTAATPRAAIAPQTRVTATAPVDPNLRVLSPYSTPAAVYAAATAPQRRRATLAAGPLVTQPLDEAGYDLAIRAIRAEREGEMIHPDQIQLASLLTAPTAALVGGFGSDPTLGARSDRFAGRAVMLLQTRSFLPGGSSFASATGRKHG